MKLVKTVDGQVVPNVPGLLGLSALILLGIFLLVGFFNSYLTVPSGYVGVETTFNKVTGELQPGFAWKWPFVQKVTMMNTQVQLYSSPETAATNDLQDVTSTVALNYHLDHAQVDNVFVNLTADYGNRVIVPLVSEAVKSVTAQYTAAELLTKRPEVTSKISQIMLTKLQPRGILVDNLNITNFAFSPQFTQAIEAKQAAQQNAEKAQFDLQKAQLDAQANQVQQAALTDQILEQQAIAKWNGVLPGTVAGNSTIFGIPLGK